MGNEVKTMKVSLIFLPPPRMFRRAGLIFFLLLLCTVSCNTVDPPPDKTVLTLTLEDVSCTEAWITLTANNLQLPATLNLIKDNSTTKTINLQTADTLLYIDSLLPNTTYNFQAIIQSSNQSIKSNEIATATLDTTSHNFTWQTWTFGEHSSSTLYDVAIVNENCIWAVGEIYMYDSLGNSVSYNAIHWNGIDWELKRILYKGGFWVIRTVFAFSENDIWFSTSVRYLNGQFIELSIPDVLIGWAKNKLWGSSSSDLYAVGNAGNIAHWNGVKWTKIESGTDVDLLDVWGSPYGTVWACGYNSEDAFTVLLRYDGNIWSKVYEGSPNNQNNNEYIGPTSGVWTNSKFFTYITSWGKIYRQPNNNTLDIKRITPNFSDVSFSIRGSNHNNIFIAGQHGLIGHYNGTIYKEITELKNQDEYLLKIDVKNNSAAAVGYNYQGFAGSTAVIHIINNN
jgi:hypothetical protein